MKKQAGFTLLEVIIAMMIMAFMSLFTVDAIQRALKTKTKVQKEIDKNSSLRDALRIMERDINLAFNYRDINTELYNQTQAARLKKAQQPFTADPKKTTEENTKAQAEQQQSAAGATEKFKKKEEKILTQFIGSPETLDFTSLSNIRLTEDAAISSQAEIGYKIKSCRRRSTQEQTSKCLWRRVSNYIHEDIQKAGEETVLLENVTEFKLRYLGPGKQEEWIDTWVSGGLNSAGADDATRGKFPYAVEITLGVKDPKTNDKVLTMTTVAAIRNPNNKKADPAPGQVGADGQPLPATNGAPSGTPVTQ